MKQSQLFKLLCDYAPLSLSDELCQKTSGYDNSGVIIPQSDEISGVLFCLDLSQGAVKRAKEIGANVIVTHHPAIYSPIKRLDGALLECARSKIGVISMHLNMDCAEKGVDYYFAKALGAKDERILLKLSNGGYGRMWEETVTLSEMVNRAKTSLSSDKVICYGDQNATVHSIACFCGAGFDEEAISSGAELIISADGKHHLIFKALEEGKSVILVTHYAGENYAFKRIYADLLQTTDLKNIKNEYYDDERLL